LNIFADNAQLEFIQPSALEWFSKTHSDLKRGKYSQAKTQKSQRIVIKLGVLASLRESPSFLIIEKQIRAIWMGILRTMIKEKNDRLI
jgi:hypothetical protein